MKDDIQTGSIVKQKFETKRHIMNWLKMLFLKKNPHDKIPVEDIFVENIYKQILNNSLISETFYSLAPQIIKNPNQIVVMSCSK